MRRLIAFSMVAGALLLAGGARAEEGLGDKVRKACHKELTTFCKGVPEGEGRVLACFYAFEDKLSDACVYALYDAASQLEQAVAAVKFAAGQCQDDLQKFCADVKPGQGRGLACLAKHDKDVSQQCKDALAQTGLKTTKAEKKAPAKAEAKPAKK
jgi:hypothetical protein